MKSKKPIIITMGEPSGIASEIIIKTWLKRKIHNIPPFILIDDLKRLKKVNDYFNFKANFHKFTKGENFSEIFNTSLPVIDLEANMKLTLGSPNKENSRFVLESIQRATNLVSEKEASSMLTLPVCKKTLKEAKFNFNGQTEYLSYLTAKKNKKQYSEIMILSTTKPVDKGGNLIVGLITTHIPLKEIHKTINKKKYSKKSNLLKILFQRSGILNPLKLR